MKEELQLRKHKRLEEYLDNLNETFDEDELTIAELRNAAKTIGQSVEYICNQYIIKNSNKTFNTLSDKIIYLSSNHIIDEKTANIMHQCRELRNEKGAHHNDQKVFAEEIKNAYNRLQRILPIFLNDIPHCLDTNVMDDNSTENQEVGTAEDYLSDMNKNMNLYLSNGFKQNYLKDAASDVRKCTEYFCLNYCRNMVMFPLTLELTIDLLEYKALISNEVARKYHRWRILGNKGSHDNNEIITKDEIETVFNEIVNYLPIFRSEFPETMDDIAKGTVTSIFQIERSILYKLPFRIIQMKELFSDVDYQKYSFGNSTMIRDCKYYADHKDSLPEYLMEFEGNYFIHARDALLDSITKINKELLNFSLYQECPFDEEDDDILLNEKIAMYPTKYAGDLEQWEAHKEIRSNPKKFPVYQDHNVIMNFDIPWFVADLLKFNALNLQTVWVYKNDRIGWVKCINVSLFHNPVMSQKSVAQYYESMMEYCGCIVEKNENSLYGIEPSVEKDFQELYDANFSCPYSEALDEKLKFINDNKDIDAEKKEENFFNLNKRNYLNYLSNIIYALNQDLLFYRFSIPWWGAELFGPNMIIMIKKQLVEEAEFKKSNILFGDYYIYKAFDQKQYQNSYFENLNGESVVPSFSSYYSHDKKDELFTIESSSTIKPSIDFIENYITNIIVKQIDESPFAIEISQCYHFRLFEQKYSIKKSVSAPASEGERASKSKRSIWNIFKH